MTVRFLNRMRMRTHQRSFGAPLGYLRFNGNPEFDLDGQQKSAKGKAPQQPDRDFEACARINERKSEERIPRHSGNCYQTLLKTTTGIWHVTYNAENRPILFFNDTTVVEMTYDYMGRRFEYKETASGTLTRHERYLYRGYLQLAALDMLNSASVKHTIIWDPTEPTATRPLALLIGTDVYYYSVDQVKNVTELFDSAGAIAATYDYSPFGQITSALSVGSSMFDVASNPLTFSSEIHDSTLGLQYYNYRHYNFLDGTWVNRDPIAEEGGVNVYGFCRNNSLAVSDAHGGFPLLPFAWDILKGTATSVVLEAGKNWILSTFNDFLNKSALLTHGYEYACQYWDEDPYKKIGWNGETGNAGIQGAILDALKKSPELLIDNAFSTLLKIKIQEKALTFLRSKEGSPYWKMLRRLKKRSGSSWSTVTYFTDFELDELTSMMTDDFKASIDKLLDVKADTEFAVKWEVKDSCKVCPTLRITADVTFSMAGQSFALSFDEYKTLPCFTYEYLNSLKHQKGREMIDACGLCPCKTK